MPVSQEKKEIPLYSPHLIKLMRAVHEKGGSFRFQARGASMSPFIRDGDILTIAKSSDKYMVGEVVAFERLCHNKLVVHRIVGLKNDRCLIKGDNGYKWDGFVSLQNIIGRVVKVERKGRDVFAGLGTASPTIAWLSRYNFLPVLLFMPRLYLKIIRRIKGE